MHKREQEGKITMPKCTCDYEPGVVEYSTYTGHALSCAIEKASELKSKRHTGPPANMPERAREAIEKRRSN